MFLLVGVIFYKRKYERIWLLSLFVMVRGVCLVLGRSPLGYSC